MTPRTMDLYSPSTMVMLMYFHASASNPNSTITNQRIALICWAYLNQRTIHWTYRQVRAIPWSQIAKLPLIKINAQSTIQPSPAHILTLIAQSDPTVHHCLHRLILFQKTPMQTTTMVWNTH